MDSVVPDASRTVAERSARRQGGIRRLEILFIASFATKETADDESGDAED
jgi:hypothetical protein